MKLCAIQKNSAQIIDFKQSTLDFELLFWSKRRFRIIKVKSDIWFYINESFKENNSIIAFPQRDLHIKSWTDVPRTVE
jgi:small-conductance mechanosensitive channel